MANGYQTNILTKSYRGIQVSSLRTIGEFGGCWQMPTQKKNQDQCCVTMTGAFGENVPTFGCCGDMSPTCWRLTQPIRQE